MKFYLWLFFIVFFIQRSSCQLNNIRQRRNRKIAKATKKLQGGLLEQHERTASTLNVSLSPVGSPRYQQAVGAYEDDDESEDMVPTPAQNPQTSYESYFWSPPTAEDLNHTFYLEDEELLRTMTAKTLPK